MMDKATVVIESVGGPVVLVGHPIGVFAATNAATARNVRALFHVAAFGPRDLRSRR